jgi:hypothetical protein
LNFIRGYQDYSNSRSLVARLRRARARHISALIETIYGERGECRIVDLGGRADYWSYLDRDLLERRHVRITLVNLEVQPRVDDPLFIQRPGDACAFDAEDGAFDLAHSNSVIEHVGDWSRMEQFAAETRRLARRYFVQTPYFWFPIEPHFSAPFFHFLPAPMRAQRFMKRAYAFAAGRSENMGEAMRLVEHARLLDKAMMRWLFPDARHVDERVAGLTKSLMAIRD